MVEYKNYDLTDIFKSQPIIKVSKDLLPIDFVGNEDQKRRMQQQMARIIDDIGRLSATAQKLNKAVTSAHILRDNDRHWVYLQRDAVGDTDGRVCGILKVGKKDLYFYQPNGVLKCFKQTPVILDFYIHESCQRQGMGGRLFERMLAAENWLPEKCAIDRPSIQMVKFMEKHYKLAQIIPQANYFTVYSSFFKEQGQSTLDKKQTTRQRHINMLTSLNGGGGAGERVKEFLFLNEK